MATRTVLYFLLFWIFAIKLYFSKPTLEIFFVLVGLGATGFCLVVQMALIRVVFFGGKITYQAPFSFKSSVFLIGKLETNSCNFVFFFTIPTDLVKGRILLFVDRKLIAIKNMPRKKNRNTNNFKLTKTSSFRLLKSPGCKGGNNRFNKSIWDNPIILKLHEEISGTLEVGFQLRFNNIRKKPLLIDRNIGLLLIRDSSRTHPFG